MPENWKAVPGWYISCLLYTSITLKFATGASECVTALNTIFTNYNKEHPNVTVEVTVLPGGVAGFNSAMASKLAAGDAPDLFQYPVSYTHLNGAFPHCRPLQHDHGAAFL